LSREWVSGGVEPISAVVDELFTLLESSNLPDSRIH
jgi:hypothetical protein